MEIKSSSCLRENIQLDKDRLAEVNIDFYGIQRKNLHRIEETVETFLHSVAEIIKKESD